MKTHSLNRHHAYMHILNVFKSQTINYSTTKKLPFSQEHFYNVVKDVDNYHIFIPWVTQSQIITQHSQNAFDAQVNIGFSQLSFAYLSTVTHTQCHQVISESSNSKIFERLYSRWNIKSISSQQCEVDYHIEMTFTNPLYAQVTNKFFDYLSTNINSAFEARCNSIQPQTTQTIKKQSDHPIDNWIWEVKDSHCNQANASERAIIQQQVIKKLKELQGMDLFKKHKINLALQLLSICRNLKSTIIVICELQAIFDTYLTEQKELVAWHALQVLIENGCVEQ